MFPIDQHSSARQCEQADIARRLFRIGYKERATSEIVFPKKRYSLRRWLDLERSCAEDLHGGAEFCRDEVRLVRRQPDERSGRQCAHRRRVEYIADAYFNGAGQDDDALVTRAAIGRDDVARRQFETHDERFGFVGSPEITANLPPAGKPGGPLRHALSSIDSTACDVAGCAFSMITHVTASSAREIQRRLRLLTNDFLRGATYFIQHCPILKWTVTATVLPARVTG